MAIVVGALFFGADPNFTFALLSALGISPSMSESPQGTWACPLCGGEVAEDDDWVVATEGEAAPGSSPESVVLNDVDIGWGGQVRFHVGHFRGRIEQRVYRLSPSAAA